MPKLKCPACGASGEIRANEDVFEERGQWPDGHWPVRKCRACGTGLILKPRVGGVKATIIPAQTWHHMQQLWDADFGTEIASDSRGALQARALLRFGGDREAVGALEVFTNGFEADFGWCLVATSCALHTLTSAEGPAQESVARDLRRAVRRRRRGEAACYEQTYLFMEALPDRTYEFLMFRDSDDDLMVYPPAYPALVGLPEVAQRTALDLAHNHLKTAVGDFIAIEATSLLLDDWDEDPGQMAKYYGDRPAQLCDAAASAWVAQNDAKA